MQPDQRDLPAQIDALRSRLRARGEQLEIEPLADDAEGAATAAEWSDGDAPALSRDPTRLLDSGSGTLARGRVAEWQTRRP